VLKQVRYPAVLKEKNNVNPGGSECDSQPARVFRFFLWGKNGVMAESYWRREMKKIHPCLSNEWTWGQHGLLYKLIEWVGGD
jgi:hypothetical protein